MAIWMIYAAAVAALIAAGGLALEKLCERLGWPRRFAWMGALTLAVVVPLTAGPGQEGLPTRAGDDVEIGAAAAAALDGSSSGAAVARQASGDGGVDVRTDSAGTFSALVSLAPLLAWALASLLGFTVLATVLFVSFRARRRWERRRIGDEQVYVSRRFGPALVGIARPVIVVPRWVVRLGDAVGATVVRHEREHARAGDHLALLYAALIVVMFPWSPPIWWMCRRLGAAVEIDCDRRVIASGVSAREYGDLLLEIGAGRQRGGLFALGMANSESLLERRLKTLAAGYGKTSLPVVILLGVLSGASLATACDIPAPAGVAPTVGAVLQAAGEAPTVAPAPPTDPEVVGSNGQIPRARDGRIVIRGRNRSPYLLLDSATVAANPLVLLDDEVLEGGLPSLLAMMDTLEFGQVGTVNRDTAVARYGEQAGGGAVQVWTRGPIWQSMGQAWRLWRSRWEEADRHWEEAQPLWDEVRRELDGAERTLEATRQQLLEAEREMQAAERELEAMEREWRAAQPEWSAADQQASSVLASATGPDGRLYIRDRTGTGSLSLGADIVARNPPVQLDGGRLRGGLSALLPMMDTLNVVTMGYYGIPPRVVITTARRDDDR